MALRAAGASGERPVGVMREVDMVGDRTGVERLQEIEGRLRIEDLGLANVLQGEPDLIAVRGRAFQL